MGKIKSANYSKTEEQLNVLTHALGFVFAVFALIVMVIKAVPTNHPKTIIGVIVFGLSMIILYGASTWYHGTKKDTTRSKLRVFDHASIYILIAGTYTPFTLLALPQPTGWILFAVTWSMALSGIIIKLFYTGRFDLLSTIMYVIMGWAIVFAFNPLIDFIGLEGFYWLLGGGIIYTIGAMLYQAGSIPYNHAIFHTFVLAGSVMHFISVYYYLIGV